jgi:hypothetical protein
MSKKRKSIAVPVLDRIVLLRPSLDRRGRRHAAAAQPDSLRLYSRRKLKNLVRDPLGSSRRFASMIPSHKMECLSAPNYTEYRSPSPIRVMGVAGNSRSPYTLPRE